MSAPRGPRLIDLMGVVVGYVLAAILVRALFPSAAREPSSARVLVVLMLEYAWMGLAMSGPIVLAIDRREDRGPSGPPRYTWAERSWLVIGAYWIALTLLIAPARLRADPRLGAMPVVGASETATHWYEPPTGVTAGIATDCAPWVGTIAPFVSGYAGPPATVINPAVPLTDGR